MSRGRQEVALQPRHVTRQLILLFVLENRSLHAYAVSRTSIRSAQRAYGRSVLWGCAYFDVPSLAVFRRELHDEMLLLIAVSTLPSSSVPRLPPLSLSIL